MLNRKDGWVEEFQVYMCDGANIRETGRLLSEECHASIHRHIVPSTSKTGVPNHMSALLM